ncbi:uncharacterized protein LOC109018726 isoform X4 [Juglans regia]|uniref:Uncharacterized protein LOC109018726 isoform X4 n=1 Tax=Juglans regia TaxID=51240 RepID=A0A2I4HJU0_JUGRE|nr:uncharacterized protein LOC109018726 isoform X4 [Juglans regia]
MAELSLCCNSLTPRALPPRPVQHPRSSPSWIPTGGLEQRRGTRAAFAAKPGGFSLNSGTGKNKKNGNIFERWKCFDCQGFGLKSCPRCGQGGLTPEQRGER